jgi:hypothetical protein
MQMNRQGDLGTITVCFRGLDQPNRKNQIRNYHIKEDYSPIRSSLM